MTPFLFSSALFISAFLLFSIQPLIAKMLLPYLGGTPAVWNTCMVFFQVMLLGGYIYSHLLPRKVGIKRHALFHLLLLAVAALALPISVSAKAIEALPSASSAPVWLLVTLLTTAGLPFFILSTNAPLLQSWFSKIQHHRARDPYFLYAASNLGSLLALLSYPVLLEPNLKLPQQSFLWAICYAVGFVLILACALILILTEPAISRDLTIEPSNDHSGSLPITWTRRLKWIALALVPSSLMLGVTTYLSTDLAPVPLLWVVPLAAYLLTFILQFSGRQANVKLWGRYALPLLTLPVTFSLACGATGRFWFFIPAHLAFFFAACMVCHGQLANDRPSAKDVTEFYLCISVGGALGGLFSALLAPLIFPTVIEYPLMVGLACLLRPRKENANRLDFVVPFLVLIALCGALIVLQQFLAAEQFLLLCFAVALIVVYRTVERPLRFACSVLAVLAAGALYWPQPVKTLHIERNFFGVLRVMSDPTGSVHYFWHGNTLHGRQYMNPTARCEPVGYYHRSGPFGSIAALLKEKPFARVAIVGLGTGGTAAYSAEGQEWTFYEIDPAVVRIARDPEYFSFVEGCSKAPITYVVGDGRLRLKEAPEGHYSIIAIDAFTSDSIPLHLLTREALELYLSRLAAGGILAFHISNRHLNLSPVLATTAESKGLTAVVMRDTEVTPQEAVEGKDPSIWVVMARDSVDLGKLTADSRWKALKAPPNFRVWTDDFTNLFSVLWR
jgi:spermidine synthase